jgi:hypothetical protein
MKKKPESQSIRISKDTIKIIKSQSIRVGLSSKDWVEKAVFFIYKTGYDIIDFENTKSKSVEDRLIGFIRRRETDFFLPMNNYFLENIKMQSLVLKGLENFGIIDLLERQEVKEQLEKKLIDPSQVIYKKVENQAENNSNNLVENQPEITSENSRKTEEKSVQKIKEYELKIQTLEHTNTVYLEQLNYLLSSIKSGGALSGSKYVININSNDLKRIKKLIL